MAEHTGGRVRRALRRAGSWLYGMAFRRGWQRWVFLAAIAALFLIIVALVRDGVDYRRDPSALVPRSTSFYAETRDLAELMDTVGKWPFWRERMVATDQWNTIHVSMAEQLGSNVGGLGTRLPLLWLANAKKAAIGFTPGEADEPESWAIYLEIGDADQALAEIRMEAGLSLTKLPGIQAENVYQLTGTGQGNLYFGVMNPWLIISSASKLPIFAVESLRRPAFSLAGSRILPSWRRSTMVRGITDPVHFVDMAGTPMATLWGWMAPETRWTFASDVNDNGSIDTRYMGGMLAGQAGESGILWPLLKIVLGIVAAVFLVVLLGTISVMLGLGGWYKYLAVRAGIAPKKAPEPVEPSAAFREDAGLLPVRTETAETNTLHDPTPNEHNVQPGIEESTVPQDGTSDVTPESGLSGSGITDFDSNKE